MSVRAKIRSNEHLWEVQHTYADLGARHLYCFGEIEDELVGKLLMSLLQMDLASDAPIYMFINSPGGSTDGGMALYDAIRNARSEVIITGMGGVASAATDIFIAGDRRLLTPETRFMVHNGSWAPSVPHASVVMAVGKEMENITRRTHERFAAVSGQSIAKIRNLFEKETFMSAEEAVAWGFAHEIVRSQK